MKVFIVMVRCRNDDRYIDSQYVERGHAVDRVNALKEEFDRNGYPVKGEPRHWFAWMVEGAITDGRLANDPAPHNTEA